MRCWHDNSDIHPFVAHWNAVLVAYGELWVDLAEQEIELSRIIVHPAHRGVGIGRSFVEALVEHSGKLELTNLLIRVVAENRQAIRCYQAAGFATTSSDDQTAYNQGQPVDYVWMRYTR